MASRLDLCRNGCLGRQCTNDIGTGREDEYIGGRTLSPSPFDQHLLKDAHRGGDDDTWVPRGGPRSLHSLAVYQPSKGPNSPNSIHIRRR